MDDPNEPCPPLPRTCPQIYDSGWVRVTVNGIAAQVNYGRFDTLTSVIANLSGAISNSGAGAYVTVSSIGSGIVLQAKTAGAAGNSIAFSVQSASNDPGDFGGGSFGGTPSGNLTGGVDAVNPVTIWDQGTVAVTAGSFNTSVPYSQSTNGSASLLAGAIAAALNVSASPVTASANGTTVTINNKTAGTGGDGLAVSVTGQSTQSQWSFSPPSFCPAPGCDTALANGMNTGDINNAPYVTLYQYDALGDLLRIDQKGSAPTDSSQWRTRAFTYDSLGRLLTAHNPESGTITYLYDPDGNLLMKTSPAPNQTGSATQSVSFCYDELNRVTKKDYAAHSFSPPACPISAPVVSYTYDVGTNAKGHMTSLADQAGTGSYTYDPLGRISSETRVISGISKSLSYDYNLDGSLKALRYPSGAVVTYTPDSAGRALSAIDSVNSINYATAATYGPDSSLTGFVSGQSAQFCRIHEFVQLQ